MNKAKIAVLTISDRASAGIYEDLSGKAINECLTEWISTEFQSQSFIIPDEFELIKNKLKELSELGFDLILTTGGTGPAPRDVTPEATLAVCQKELPGFGELMRSVSLKYVPTAILSRQTAGICAKSLIVNLPGQPKAIKECLEPVFGAIPYCLDLIGAGFIDTYEQKIKTFRPKNSKIKDEK